MNLFKKAAVFTDLHAGLKSNSITHNEDCLNFGKWFVKTAQAHNCETCLFLGDFFHNRNSINLLTMNYGLQIMQLLNDSFNRVILIPGNHDCYYKDKRSIHSVEWANHLPNIEVINEWHKEGNVIFVPWMIGDDHKKISRAQAKYMMGHFELPNFLMNQMVRMPDVGEIAATDFTRIEKVFSGHFHKRQMQNNIYYIGNAFPHNYADTNDDERGMMMLSWDCEPQFLSWPDAPKYRSHKLSDLLKNPSKLKANSYVKINLDIDISYEEAGVIKESFINEYQLREVSLISAAQNEEHTIDGAAGEITVDSVDTIVTNNITAIESEFYSAALLLDIYRDL